MPVIATNNAANTALNYLNRNSALQSQSLQRLSSGSRITTAKDDAAGLAVSTQISADISTLEQAARNAQHGQAILQVADGALSTVADILTRMKSLAAQSKSGAVDAQSRGYLQQEWVQIRLEIQGINLMTTWLDQRLLAGSYQQDFMVGDDAGDVISIDFFDPAFDFRAFSLGVNGNSINNQIAATNAMDEVDLDLDKVANARAVIGALQSRFAYRGDVIASQIENLQAARSAIQDVDVAAETTRLTNYQVLTDAAVASLAQANELPRQLLRLVRPEG